MGREGRGMLERDEDLRLVVMNSRCTHPKSITPLEKRMEEFEAFIFRSRGDPGHAAHRRPAAFTEEHPINLQQKLQQQRGLSFLPRKWAHKGRKRLSSQFLSRIRPRYPQRLWPGSAVVHVACLATASRPRLGHHRAVSLSSSFRQAHDGGRV